MRGSHSPPERQSIRDAAILVLLGLALVSVKVDRITDPEWSRTVAAPAADDALAPQRGTALGAGLLPQPAFLPATAERFAGLEPVRPDNPASATVECTATASRKHAVVVHRDAIGVRVAEVETKNGSPAFDERAADNPAVDDGAEAASTTCTS